MCVALSDNSTHQGATLGIIRCLEAYVVLLTQGFERLEAICRHQHIKHCTHKHKLQAEGRTQLCNHCSLVLYVRAHTHTGFFSFKGSFNLSHYG